MTPEQYTAECLATQFQWTVLNLALPEDNYNFKLAAEGMTQEDIEFARDYVRRMKTKITVATRENWPERT